MTTTVVWVLLIVTAINRDDFTLQPVAEYPTMAECYVASTKLFWDDVPINQELLCMRVGGQSEKESED